MKEDENRIVVDCEFRINCPREWDALTPTGDDLVRFCDVCSRDVHYCRNAGEYLSHASSGRCVAVRVPSDTEEGVVTIGEPDLDAYQNRQRGYSRDAGKS